MQCFFSSSYFFFVVSKRWKQQIGKWMAVMRYEEEIRRKTFVCYVCVFLFSRQFSATWLIIRTKVNALDKRISFDGWIVFFSTWHDTKLNEIRWNAFFIDLFLLSLGNVRSLSGKTLCVSGGNFSRKIVFHFFQNARKMISVFSSWKSFFRQAKNKHQRHSYMKWIPMRYVSTLFEKAKEVIDFHAQLTHHLHRTLTSSSIPIMIFLSFCLFAIHLKWAKLRIEMNFWKIKMEKNVHNK